MRLYLVQHGEAASKEADPDRQLTGRGRADIEAMGAFLRRAGVWIPLIWHSGKARARQTAELLAAELVPMGSIEGAKGLKPNDPTEPIRNELVLRQEDLAVVGHLPFLSNLASELLCGVESAGPVQFQQGGVLCIERAESGPWRVQWMVTPDLLRGA
jgi:phosphohistidine phosphatase